MKRDMDLIRALLFEVEKWPFTGGFDTVAIPNRTQEEIAYHVYLAYDAGLIDAVDASSHDGPQWYPKHLTNQGHEFLNAARADTTWNKAKETVINKTGALTLEALKIALGSLMKHALTTV
jgi:Hypothetical protein (DUF2513)